MNGLDIYKILFINFHHLMIDEVHDLQRPETIIYTHGIYRSLSYIRLYTSAAAEQS